jgi:hypothetical protein
MGAQVAGSRPPRRRPMIFAGCVRNGCHRRALYRSELVSGVSSAGCKVRATVQDAGNRQVPTGRLCSREDRVLDLDRHQGRFGEHFAQLIASAAGYTCYKPDDTGDGVDLVITHTQHDGVTVRPPNVELQVKTVRAPSFVSNDTELSYDLEIAHYNALRAPGPTRRYLVIVIVPGRNHGTGTDTERSSRYSAGLPTGGTF